MHRIYDIGIIGMGVAGTFACLKLSQEHKNLKIIGFDIGRPPRKRRQQLVGFLGCLPNSDGKLYLNDVNEVAQLVGNKTAKAAHKWVNKVFSQVGNFETIKDHSPSLSLSKKINKIGYNIKLNNFIQTYPKDSHLLSKYFSETVEQNDNINFCFDAEVNSIRKQKNMFILTVEGQEIKCKKIIIAAGRSGWRWVRDVYSSFDIIDNNDTAHFGIRIEMSAELLKDFNRSSCSLIKNNEINIGPLSWFGTVIPEDHVDVAISSFRSNENRWASDKVSFNLIGNRPYPNKGFEQTDRISKLIFILSNDRIVKERISYIMSGKSKISIIPEYDWIKNTLEELSSAIPDIINKAYYHVPTIIPMVPKINIGTNLSTEIDNMFVAGEAAGVSGLLSAACMGSIVSDAIA